MQQYKLQKHPQQAYLYSCFALWEEQANAAPKILQVPSEHLQKFYSPQGTFSNRSLLIITFQDLVASFIGGPVFYQAKKEAQVRSATIMNFATSQKSGTYLSFFKWI